MKSSDKISLNPILKKLKHIPQFAALMSSSSDTSTIEDAVPSADENYDWAQHGRKYTEAQLGCWKTWFRDRKEEERETPE